MIADFEIFQIKRIHCLKRKFYILKVLEMMLLNIMRFLLMRFHIIIFRTIRQKENWKARRWLF